jgi:SAM-dependent methyltransferase
MTSEAAQAGSRVYTKSTLSIYDISVLWFSNLFVWKCPTPLILDFYNRYISDNHLDVGVGTGYFLDKCRFPSATPQVTLVDLNASSLQKAAERIGRYRPTVHLADILQPLPITSTFDSIGLSYLLHCLPGTMLSKEKVFQNLKPVLNSGGVIFGTTILGKDAPHGFLAKRFLKIYNRSKIFTNTEDSYADLETILARNFQEHSLHTVGCVAFFVGQA